MATMTDHIAAGDNAEISRIISSTNYIVRQSRCDSCGESFKYAVNLLLHQTIHADGLRCCCLRCRNKPNMALTCEDKPDVEFLALIGSHYERFFRCIRCGRRFQLHVELRRHNAMRHHSSAKPHTGEHCRKNCVDTALNPQVGILV